MATLQTDEPNIIDAETINWRLIVYPLLVVLIVGIGAVGYYYYLQNQRNESETTARQAMLKATTPADLLKIAEQYPNTDQATLAILKAANDSFNQRDYAASLDAYNKITANAALSDELHDTAELGIASVNEATNDTDKAIAAYLEVAHRGDKSPFAPYAYIAAARIYEQRGDKDNERHVVQEAAALDPDSYFTHQAQMKLKQMDAAAQPPLTVPLPDSSPEPAAPASPAPAPAAPAR